MWSFIRQHKLPLIGAMALHVALVGLLSVSLSLSRPYDVRPPPLAVRATVVDAERIEAEMNKLEQAERAEELEQQRRAEEARREAEQARKAQEEERQRLADLKAQQQAEEKRRQDEAAKQQAQLEQQRKEMERKQEEERQRLVELERQRKEAEERARAEQERIARQKREEEERRRQQAREEQERRAREAQLQAELEAEEQRLAQEQQAAMHQYVEILRQRVERNWVKPASAQPGLNCAVRVHQLPDGSVISATVQSCNGDAAVVRSIELAVQRSSPLPLPQDRRLFQREIVFEFRPDQ